MNTYKTAKMFFVLFLSVAIVCLTLSAGLFINAGCKKHDPVYYTVTFDTNGGSAIEAKEVEAGTAVEKPADPTRESFKFEGWVKSDNTPYNFSDEVTENITLYAKWSKEVAPVTYKVNFYVNGVLEKSVDVESGGTVERPADPVKEGKEFDKWVTAGSSEAFNFSTRIESELNLYAIWKADSSTGPDNPPDPTPPDPTPPDDTKKFTVTFDLDGGTSAVTSAEVKEGDKVAEPEAPTKTDCDFVAWVDKDGNVFDFANTAITSDITIKATWETKHFTVTFDSDGGSAVTAQRQAKGEKAVKPADPTKTNFTFAGWFTEDGKAYDFNTPVTADITLKAKWTANGGTTPTEPVATPHTFTYDYSKITNPPTTDSGQLTQSNFTGDNSFLKIEEEKGKVTYRSNAIKAGTADCIENKDGGISVTFKGTGTISITFCSTNKKNVSSLGLKDADGNFVAASTVGTGAKEVNGVYEVGDGNGTGTTQVTVTFTIEEAGTYTIYCSYSFQGSNGQPSSRGARLYGITMVDNYVDETNS